MTDTINTGNIKLIRENEDGSADYQFNFPPEALEALTRLGILTAIQAGIEDAKHLKPEEEEETPDFTPVIKELAEEAGFALWGGEKYKPTGAVVDWACEYDDELVRFYRLVRKQAVKDAKRLNPDESYMELMDAHAKELDRAMELLRRAEVEMRYAGWTNYESGSARNGVLEQIVRFLYDRQDH